MLLSPSFQTCCVKKISFSFIWRDAPCALNKAIANYRITLTFFPLKVRCYLHNVPQHLLLGIIFMFHCSTKHTLSCTQF